MILGFVNTDYEAIINLFVRGPKQQEQEIETVFNIYEGTVIWNGQARRILIEHADADPLVGMSLLYGNSLSMQIVEGGSVIINALPHEKPMA